MLFRSNALGVAASMSTPPLPHLYVDLDGTLIATDLLHESSLLLLRGSPISILRMPFWLLSGKAVLKREIALRVTLDAAALPYRPGVLELIRQARQEGRAWCSPPHPISCWRPRWLHILPCLIMSSPRTALPICPAKQSWKPFKLMLQAGLSVTRAMGRLI